MTAFDQRAFRDALGHFPTGVAVVTAPNPGGDPVAITVSSFNAVSLDPPLVLFGVAHAARSLGPLLDAEHFGICILRDDQSELSARFARPRSAKWSGIEPCVGETGCPLLEPCLATFECAPHAVHEGGDHLIIVGRVVAFRREEAGDPLVFFRGAYHAIAARA